MGTAADALRIAASQIGTVENPAGSNRQKYSAALGRPAESWCADFCEWVLNQVGVTVPVNTYGNASTLVRCWGDIHIAPRPGDLVGYHFAGEPAGINHVGMVESVDLARQTVTSIEGNTTAGEAGVQSNGGGVYRRVRPLSQVVGFGRPTYQESAMPDMPNYALSGVPCSISAVFDAQGNVKGYYVMTDDGSIAAIGQVPYLGRVHKA